MKPFRIMPTVTASDSIGDFSDPAAAPRKGILVRVPRERRKALRQLALDHDTTLQALMVEAIDDLMVKHEHPDDSVSD